jgi:hypothetical protein
MTDAGYEGRFARYLAAMWLRTVRKMPYDMTPWDTCVVAGSKARMAGDLEVYREIREVAVRFKPTPNVFLGDLMN